MEKKKKFKDLVGKDEYWMGVLLYLAALSPNRQGALIANQENEMLSYGLDAPPKSIYCDTEHILAAEINAISNSSEDFTNCCIYLTHTPSYNSVLQIISSGIKRIIYLSTETLGNECLSALKQGSVTSYEFRGNLNWLRDYLQVLNELGIFNHK